MTEQNTLLQAFEQSISADTFVRLTLSKNRTKAARLKKVVLKLAMIKNQLMLSFVYRHDTQDITKNFSLADGKLEVEKLMRDTFLIYSLFTVEKDLTLTVNKKGKARLQTRPPTFNQIPPRSHDKAKERHIDGKNYLTELGVLDAMGRIQKDKGDKFKQINKFVEIIASLLRQNPHILNKKKLKVVDMGAGKGYLTFALYDYLVHVLKLDSQVIGIEIRTNLIELCNRIAQKVGFQHLHFEKGFISNYHLTETDILIALHACDTATDDAIFKGIQAEAALIICAPCCHKQIRKQMKTSTTFQSVLNYGILKERQAEIVTDTIRALLLESQGYKTKVFEFISTEHTGKNVMIVGQRQKMTKDKNFYLKQIEDLKNEFSIRSHYLEDLLRIKN